MVASIPYSFELFPPRTDKGMVRLPEIVRRLADARPGYFSVTHGAGGSAQDGTYETVLQVVEHAGIEAAPHLTCVAASDMQLETVLERYRAAGVRRLVALRGDLPEGMEAPSGGFRYAEELVRFVRRRFGDHFRIEVAAYPEMHPQAPDLDTDFAHFRRKVEAGADAAITQYFFNADAYSAFLERCARAGLAIPIVPGIMPIVNVEQLTRFSASCGAEIPRWLRLSLEPLANDAEAVQRFGTEVVARLCERLIAAGAPGLHFYTLNRPEPTLALLDALGWR